MRAGPPSTAWSSGLALALAVVVGMAACRDEPEVPSDAGTSAPGAPASPTAGTPQVPVLPEVPLPADPVAALHPYLPGENASTSWCVQIRSVPSREESDALRGRIEDDLGLATHAFEAEVKGRGTWYRICVGAEPSQAAAETKARAWTKRKGALRPYMTQAEDGQASYFIKERPGAPSRVPTKAQAKALLRGRPSKERPVFLARLDGGGFLAALTVELTEGASDALVVAPDGAVLPIAGEPAGDCAPCRAALTGEVPLLRRVLGVGDVGPWPGEELLLEERAPAAEGRSTAILSVVSLDGDRALRRAAFLLGTHSPSLVVLGEARAVEADGEPGAELAILRRELPLIDDQLCALRLRAEIIDLDESGARRLDENYAAAMATAEQSGGARPVRHLVQAFDSLGDFDAASRACAAYLARGRDAQVARLCIGRIQRLTDERRLVHAANAAGLVAGASAPFRAAVAAPFFRVAARLDEDARLTATPADCQAAPLVTGVSQKRLEHVVRLAEVRLAERLNLADVADAVFVTGARDFGPKTPVGELTARWLEQVRTALPARYAAIQAALLPPPGAPAAPRDEPRPSLREESPQGGYIRIEVADDDPEALGSPRHNGATP